MNRHGHLMLSMVGTACFLTRLSHHCWGALAVSGRTVTMGLTMQSGFRVCARQREGVHRTERRQEGPSLPSH